MIAYEQRLNRDLNWALREGSMHFEEKNAVHAALRKVTRALEELEIPYAVVGGMALFSYGLRRFTEDVNILVTAEGLEALHRHLEGLGYLPLFTGSKHLRDSANGVRIEFLVSGRYPGDGTPKPVTFPEPEASSTEVEGMRLLQLPRLIELKLASGMSPGRRRDLGDVQELIRLLSLPVDYAEQLNRYVRDLYKELWIELQKAPPAP
jgi:hypothetical protein